MKRYIYSLLVLLFVLPAYSQQGEPLITYTISYKAENSCNAIMLHGNKGVTVDWGNGQKESLSPDSDRMTLYYQYPADGEYTVRVFGEPDAVQTMELYDDTDVTSVLFGNGCEIEFLSCYGLSQLDISTAIRAKSLHLGGGKLATLNLTANPDIEYLNLYENPIAKDKVALLEMIESLPDRSGKESGTLVIGMGNFPRHKAICERKNWIVK